MTGDRRSRRRSAQVVLVLLGGLSLAGCDGEPDQRQVYRSREDCHEEWGEQRCEPAGSGHPHGHYYGPYYRGSPPAFHHSDGTARPSRSVGSVSRGGFGKSSSGHGVHA